MADPTHDERAMDDDQDDGDEEDEEEEDDVEEEQDDEADADAAAVETRTVRVLRATAQARGRECVDALIELCTLCASSPAPIALRPETVRLLYSILSEPQQGPPRVRLLCARALLDAAPSKTLTMSSFDPPVDRRQLPYVFPLLVARGERAVLRKHLPLLVRSAVAAEQDVRTAAYAALGRLAFDLGRPPVPLDGIDVQMRELLRNASTVSASKPAATGSFWGKQPVAATPCTEIDGSPLREFFTALNHSTAYTPDQLLNVYTFSMLRPWLTAVFLSDEGREAKPIDPDLLEVIVKYCVRLIEQGEVLWNPTLPDYRARHAGVTKSLRAGAVLPAADVDYMAVEAALVEAVHLLSTLCQVETALIARLMPMMKRLYNRNISLPAPHGLVFVALAQFFAAHASTVVYDPDPVYASLFQTFLSAHYADATVAFEVMRFCVRFAGSLARQSKLFDRYFPSIIKLVAWHPQVLAEDLLALLPTMVHGGTFVELLHSLLDLPVISAALEHLSRNKDLLNISPDLPPEQMVAASANRALFNYILRSEAGIGNYNFWSPTTWPLLLEFYQSKLPASARVLCCGALVPHLVTAYTRIALARLSQDDLETLIPIIFERVAQIYPLQQFVGPTVKALMNMLVAIVTRQPHLVLSLRRLFLEFLDTRANSEGREELLIHVATLVGTYATPMVDPSLAGEVLYEFYEAIELLAYEANMTIAANVAGEATPDTSSSFKHLRQSLSSGDESFLSTRMLSALISALAKLAARSPDLIPRALLCISKVVKSHQRYVSASSQRDRSLLQRANELSRLLRMPSVASAILDPPIGRAVEGAAASSSHVDRNSSLPLLLFPAHDDPRRDDLYAEGVPHATWPALHAFTVA